MKSDKKSNESTQYVSLRTGMGYRLNQAVLSQHPDSNFVSKWFKQQRHDSFKYAKSLVK